MKTFVLCHNLIGMAQATILNSPEKYMPVECEEIAYQLQILIANFHHNGELTDYQFEKLHSYAESISTMCN